MVSRLYLLLMDNKLYLLAIQITTANLVHGFEVLIQDAFYFLFCFQCKKQNNKAN